MSALWLPSSRISQPHGPTGIDRSNPLTRGLWAAWQLSASGINKDAASLRDLINTSTALTPSTRGVVGDFNGTTSRLVTALYPSFAESVSVAFWMLKTSAAGVARRCFTIGNGGTIKPLIAVNYQDAYTVAFVNSGGTRGANLGGLGNGGWIHCGGVLNSSGNWDSVYINGVAKSVSDPISYTTDTHTGVKVGTRGNLSGNFFQGQLADVVIFERGLSEAEFVALFNNSRKIFQPSARRIYVDGAATGGATHNVLIANSAQANALTTGAIRQTHLTLTANGVQANIASAGTVNQVHRVVGANAMQANVASVGSISQAATTFVAGSNCHQANVASAVAIRQTHLLATADSVQASVSAAGAILQIHQVIAANAAQAHVATAGSVSQDATAYVAGSHSAQANVASTGIIKQTHLIVAAPVAIDNIAAASAIVQAHLLIGANSAQANRATSGRIYSGLASALAGGDVLNARQRIRLMDALAQRRLLDARPRSRLLPSRRS